MGSLPRLLDSIDAQSLKPAETVICDGGSTDGTLELLKSWQSNRSKVKLIEHPGANIAAGRNAAIEKCQSTIICVTDGGCVLDKNWLKTISQPLLDSDGSLGVVYGKTVPIGHGVIGRQFSAFYDAKTRLHSTETELSSRAVAFRRSVWESTGGYPEWLTLAGEDTYFFRQLAKVTNSIFVEGAIVYWHHEAESLRKIYRQQFRNSTAAGELNTWPPLRYQFLFGLYAAIVAGLITSLWKQRAAIASLILLTATTSRQAPSMFRIKNKSALAFGLLPPIAFARDLGMIRGYLAGQKIRKAGADPS